MVDFRIVASRPFSELFSAFLSHDETRIALIRARLAAEMSRQGEMESMAALLAKEMSVAVKQVFDKKLFRDVMHRVVTCLFETLSLENGITVLDNMSDDSRLMLSVICFKSRQLQLLLLVYGHIFGNESLVKISQGALVDDYWHPLPHEKEFFIGALNQVRSAAIPDKVKADIEADLRETIPAIFCDVI